MRSSRAIRSCMMLIDELTSVVKQQFDATEKAIGISIRTERHKTTLRFVEAERRIAELEAKIEDLTR